MKKLLIVSLILLSVGLCQNRVNVNNLVKYGDKYFKENDDRPYNGIVFDRSKRTGNKILEYKIVDGLKNGLYRKWYPNGKSFLSGKFFNDDTTGKWTYWYENEQKEKEGIYKDNKEDGLWTSWYENGHKKSEINYIKGSREGLMTEYHDNGEKKSEITNNNDKRLDNWSYWDKIDGKKYSGKVFEEEKKMESFL